VIAALAGREVDRGPTRLLMHNFASENSARGLAAETLRLARTFDWDYLKPPVARAVLRGDVGSHVSSVDRTCDTVHDQATSGAERRRPHAPCAGSERDWSFFAKAATAASVSDTQHLA
jgi:hypothetical protein